MTGWLNVGEPPTTFDDVWVVLHDGVELGRYSSAMGGWMKYDENGDPYLVSGVTLWQLCKEKPALPATALFVGGSDSKGSESAVITNETATQGIVFDTAAMDG